MIDVHYWPTPNGKKVTIFLEEAGAPYRVVPCNIGRGDQFKPEFLAWNPNHRMPVIVDHAPADGGPPLAVFESGAILLYLADKLGQFFPRDVRGRAEVQQWVVWQMANQGPKLGEYGFFHRLGDSQGDQSVGRRRYADEANRLYGVLDNRLYDRRYVAGDTYSIVLTEQPSANVIIDLLPRFGQVQLSASQLVFTPDNFNVPQVVNVSALDDGIAESEAENLDVIDHTASSADASYDGVTVAVVEVTVRDPAFVALESDTLNVFNSDSQSDDAGALTGGARPGQRVPWAWSSGFTTAFSGRARAVFWCSCSCGGWATIS